jgi:hypothetical protein
MPDFSKFMPREREPELCAGCGERERDGELLCKQCHEDGQQLIRQSMSAMGDVVYLGGMGSGWDAKRG